MKYPILFFLLLVSFRLDAQFCTNNARFTEVDFFQESQIDSLLDIEYGQALDYQDSLNILRLDIYMPKLSEDSLSDRPFVLQMFGGGFVVGDKMLMRGDCMELAKKGFVCASINYRLGDVAGGRAIYRAQQDAHAAMRWIVANAETYGINTDWLFAGGQSAGAIAAAYLHYSGQEDWNAFTPTIEDELGSIDASGNDLTADFELKGIIMNWGAVRIDDITPAEMIPMIAFHGDEDPIVIIDTTTLGSGGSRWLHNELVDNNICSDLTVAPGAGHSPPVLFAPTFRMPKASCFFKSIFCESCETVYVEENVAANCSTLTSTADKPAVDEIAVFPNPFTERINISGLNGTETFILFNAIGKVVFSGNNLPNTDFTALPAGIYFLRIEQDAEFQTIKLVKD